MIQKVKGPGASPGQDQGRLANPQKRSGSDYTLRPKCRGDRFHNYAVWRNREPL